MEIEIIKPTPEASELQKLFERNEFFKKLKTNPYTGSSEKDFLIYIRKLIDNVPEELEDIDYETYQSLCDLKQILIQDHLRKIFQAY